FTIELPPLRARGDDLPRLIDYLLRRFSRELGKDVQSVEPSALALLTCYPWPGNVRELQNVLQQALLKAAGPLVLVDHLTRLVRDVPGAADEVEGDADWERFVEEGLREEVPGLYGRAVEKLDRMLLTRVLRHTGGHQTRAAELLGITRGSLRHKLRVLGLTAA